VRGIARDRAGFTVGDGQTRPQSHLPEAMTKMGEVLSLSHAIAGKKGRYGLGFIRKWKSRAID